LGRAALLAGELEQARKHFQEGVSLAQQAADRRGGAESIRGFTALAAGHPWFTRIQRPGAECIWGLAALAAAQQEWQLAMQLGGLVSALQASAGYQFAPIEQARYQQMLTAVRSHLDDTAAELAWEQGRAMSIEGTLLDTL
jgi:hypothetical protein